MFFARTPCVDKTLKPDVGNELACTWVAPECGSAVAGSNFICEILLHGLLQVLSALRHPHIVPYVEYFWEEDEWECNLCLVMAHCEGGDLCADIGRRRKEQRPFTEEEVLPRHHHVYFMALPLFA
eukprot:1478424-Pyramimonas_sp.AAC.2